MLPVHSVATLIADADRADLDEASVGRVRSVLASLGAEIVATHWLADKVACDVVFTGLDRDAARGAIARRLTDAPCDIVVQRRPGRRKDLLIADTDFTVVANDTVDEIGKFMGIKDKLAAIGNRARRGEIELGDALRQRLTMLQGTSTEALEVGFEAIKLRTGARTLVQTMRAHGAWTVLISSGPDLFADRVREAAGFHESVANQIDLDAGMIQGRLREPLLDAAGKAAALSRIAHDRGIPLSETLAVGSGAGELAMLRQAGLGILFRPTGVAGDGVVRIKYADLTALLYLQGYSLEEFRD